MAIVAEAKPAAPGRRYAAIGWVLAGLAVALVLGYLLGVRSGSAPPAEPENDSVPSRSAKAPASRHASTDKTAEPSARPERSGRPKTEATTPLPAADGPRWAQMRTELDACGTFNLVCSEKVRWRYCKDYWGKVPECPQSSTN